MFHFPDMTYAEEGILQDELALSENEFQDFKQRINDDHKIARSLAAFANARGGKLWIGVSDRGEVLGTDVKSAYYNTCEILETFCRPVPDVSFLVHEQEDLEVLEIIIAAGNNKPYLTMDKKGIWAVYIRSGDRNVKMKSET